MKSVNLKKKKFQIVVSLDIFRSKNVILKRISIVMLRKLHCMRTTNPKIVEILDCFT